MKKSILLLLLSSAVLGFAQDKNAFIDFGNEKVSKEEFKRIYQKNNSGEMVSKSTVDEYLDLYINFKLKVKEAEARGLDTVSSFVSELAGYRKQLAQPYLSADAVLDELKKEAYDRLQYDVRASHILVTVSQDASPEDTLKAYKKIQELKKRIEKGEDFAKVAKENSDDPSAAENSGDLGYFTAFYMVYPFESAAYETKVGEISDIIRSRFGYHILKIVDKREAVGSASVAHILISSDPDLSKTDDPKGKIFEIYEKLKKSDGSFEEMAAQFSDDTRTASNGGVLPTFSVGRMVPEFEKVAFSLENDGDISEPFQTQFGWHIIKRLRRDKIGTYEEVEAELTQRVKKDTRSNLTEGVVLKKIKKQYGFKEKLGERDDFYTVLDSSYSKGKWTQEKSAKLKKFMFSIGDAQYTQKDFADYLFKRQKRSAYIDPRVLVNRRYEEFKKEKILAYKDARLDKEYPEFAALMQEYHDGILLFNLTDKLVWNKAVEDTSGLKAFYEAHKEEYKWAERADAIVFNALNKEIANKAITMLKEGKKAKEVLEIINKSSQLNLKYEQKKYERGEHEVVDMVEWKEGISKTIDQNNRVYFVKIKEVLAPSYKTLEDSRGIITSDFQEFLEKEWIEELRNKYDFKVNQDILKALRSELK
jgi:peptidyl-prolyl cis-trans isomerase SurA